MFITSNSSGQSKITTEEELNFTKNSPLDAFEICIKDYKAKETTEKVNSSLDRVINEIQCVNEQIEIVKVTDLENSLTVNDKSIFTAQNSAYKCETLKEHSQSCKCSTPRLHIFLLFGHKCQKSCFLSMKMNKSIEKLNTIISLKTTSFPESTDDDSDSWSDNDSPLTIDTDVSDKIAKDSQIQEINENELNVSLNEKIKEEPQEEQEPRLNSSFSILCKTELTEYGEKTGFDNSGMLINDFNDELKTIHQNKIVSNPKDNSEDVHASWKDFNSLIKDEQVEEVKDSTSEEVEGVNDSTSESVIKNVEKEHSISNKLSPASKIKKIRKNDSPELHGPMKINFFQSLCKNKNNTNNNTLNDSNTKTKLIVEDKLKGNAFTVVHMNNVRIKSEPEEVSVDSNSEAKKCDFSENSNESVDKNVEINILPKIDISSVMSLKNTQIIKDLEEKRRKDHEKLMQKLYNEAIKKEPGMEEEPILDCKHCDVYFESREKLIEHIKDHVANNILMCLYCQRKFKDKTGLKRHTRIHTGEKPYKCKICDRTFSLPGNFKKHRDIHNDLRTEPCEICGKTFKRREHLLKHNRIHTGEKPHTCSLCPAAFAARYTLQIHMNNHLGKKPFKCSYCEKAFGDRSTMKKHVRTHTGERPFFCSVCGKSFSESGTLNGHMSTHTKERPYHCSSCPLTFKTNSGRRQHMKIHSGIKEYSCGFCGHKFMQKFNLLQHERIHTGEKPFSCFHCERKFRSKSYLQKHLTQTHGGDAERKFNCNLCAKKFFRPAHLQRHIESHMGVRSFECDQCNKKFAAKVTLRTHKFTFHSEGARKFPCDACGKVFKRKIYVKTHVCPFRTKVEEPDEEDMDSSDLQIGSSSPTIKIENEEFLDDILD